MATLVTRPVNARDIASSDTQPRDYPTVKAVEFVDRRLQQRTDGRLKISLGHSDRDSESYTLSELRSGRLDMARITLTAFQGGIPEAIVPSLPFLFASTAHKRLVLDGPIGQELLDALEREGVVGLAFYDAGARSFYGHKAIRRPADLNGVSVRVQPSDYWSRFMTMLGARPVPLPFNRVEAALRTKLVEVAENHDLLYYETQHYRVANVFSVTEHTRAPSVLVFSKMVWDRLRPEDRQAIREAARDSVPYMRDLWDQREAETMSALRTAGVDFVTDIDRDAFRQSVMPLYDFYVREGRLKNWVKQIRLASP